MTDSNSDRSGWVSGALLEIPCEGPLPEFTEFEERVLRDLGPLFGEDEALYLEQVQKAEVIDRINTKVGFYTRVNIDRSVCRPVEYAQRGGWFDVADIENGVGVTLWDEDGYLDTIEGYTVDDDPLSGRQLSELRYMGIVQIGYNESKS